MTHPRRASRRRGPARPAQLSARDWRVFSMLGSCGYYLTSFLDFAGQPDVTARAAGQRRCGDHDDLPQVLKLGGLAVCSPLDRLDMAGALTLAGSSDGFAVPPEVLERDGRLWPFSAMRNGRLPASGVH